MSSKQDIKKDLVESLKNRNSVVVMTLRSFLAEIEKKEIELGKKDIGLTEEEIEKVALGELKKRNEAIEQYKKGGRSDLVKDEKREASVLGKYVPEMMSDAELESIVDGIIKEKNPSGMQDMGVVMKEVVAYVKNRADGSKISNLVRKKLQSI